MAGGSGGAGAAGAYSTSEHQTRFSEGEAAVNSVPNEHWIVPGEWLEIYTTNSAAKRIEQSSEVLPKLEEIRRREEAKNQPQPWILTKQADIIFAAVIIAYGLLTGVDVEITVSTWPGQVSKEYETGMLIAQGVFSVIFLIELVLRVLAEGFRYCLPFIITYSRPAPGAPRRLQFQRCNMAGCLDTGIILFGIAEVCISVAGMEGVSLAAASPMRMLRLVRLVRIIKGLMVFEELKLLCVGMVSSLSAVFWAFALLAVLMYLGSLFCVILLGKNLQLSQYFNGVGQALFTHFMIVTLEAWPDISDDVIEASSPFWGVYFIIFICVSSLALMNLVTGVVCEKLLDVSRTDDEEEQPNQLEAFREDRERFREKVSEIFHASDVDLSETLDCDEFAIMRERSDMRRLFKLMDVSDDLDSTTLFKMLDVREQGTLTCEDLSEGLLRLRGSRRRIHSLMLQRDILQRHRREAKRVAELEENLRERTRAELSAVEDAVVAKLATLQQSILASRDVQGDSTVASERCSEKLVHDTPPMVVGKVLEVGAALAKQPDGIEETMLNLLKGEAETTKVCGGLLQGDLPQKPGCSEECDAMAPRAAKSAPLRAQPWMQEAGGRLEALIQELDSLHSWAEDLVVPVPPSPA